MTPVTISRSKEEVLESIRGCIRIDHDIDRRYDEEELDAFEYVEESVHNACLYRDFVREAKQVGCTAEELVAEVEATYIALDKKEEGEDHE